MKVNFGEIWPKATGLIGNPVLDIHVTFWRKTKVICWISALNHVEWYVAQHIFEKICLEVPSHIFSKIFFFEKTFYFLKDDSLSGIRLFLSKWKPFLSQKTLHPPAYTKAPHVLKQSMIEKMF
jgi:hypothetical protein